MHNNTYVQTLYTYVNKTMYTHECFNLHRYQSFLLRKVVKFVSLFHGCELDSSLLPPTIVCHNLNLIALVLFEGPVHINT